MDEFSYKAVAAGPVAAGGWSAGRRAGWLSLVPEGTEGQARVGWNIHVSVREQDVGSAWDALSGRVRPYRISMEAAAPDVAGCLADQTWEHRGRAVTLRLGEVGGDDPEGWAALVQEIERDLSVAGVRPGLDAPAARPVRGSAFLSYGNDDTPAGRCPEPAASYNPHGFRGPLFGARLRAENSLRRLDADATRQRLDAVQPGWAALGGGFRHHDGDGGRDLARVLQGAGIQAGHHAGTTVVPAGVAAQVCDGWHAAREALMAVQFGRAIQAALREADAGAPTLSIRARAADHLPPRVRLSGIDREAGKALAAVLAEIGLPASADGGVLAAYYGGLLHAGGRSPAELPGMVAAALAGTRPAPAAAPGMRP